MRTTLRIKSGNRIHKVPVTLRITEDRIWFDKQTFNKKLNAEIKAMKGYKWHGFQDPPVKKWSIANHPRNVFQLQALMGNNPYEWFERPIENPLVAIDFSRPKFAETGGEINGAQIDMVSRSLNYHYQIWAAEQGLGKCLAAIELMERSGKKEFWFVGPKSALASFEEQREFWELDPSINVVTMTYEGLVSTMRYDFHTLKVPDGVFFDETDNLKNPASQRAEAAQALADLIRETHGFEGYVTLLSGTPSAKHPTDLWSQCEIAWPGFLREGNFKAFEMRYAVMTEVDVPDGTTYTKRVGWNEAEVAALPKRYDGLMTVYRKSDWLKLPEKQYKTIRLDPSNKVLRVAKSLTNIAPNTITALTWLRELSSGFQYKTVCVGEQPCPVCKGTGFYEFAADGKTCPGCGATGRVKEWSKETKQVTTPKDTALNDIFQKMGDKFDNLGRDARIVVAASFQGSIDRIVSITQKDGWATCVVDGRGWRCYNPDGTLVRNEDGKSPEQNTLHFWNHHKGKVAFVGNPGSCRYGLTLTLAHTLVFYDNSFSAVHRLQMEDRIHRQSMDMELGALIIDLVHLPVDQLVIDTLKSNKKLELLSLGALRESIGIDEDVTEEIVLD